MPKQQNPAEQADYIVRDGQQQFRSQFCSKFIRSVPREDDSVSEYNPHIQQREEDISRIRERLHRKPRSGLLLAHLPEPGLHKRPGVADNGEHDPDPDSVRAHSERLQVDDGEQQHSSVLRLLDELLKPRPDSAAVQRAEQRFHDHIFGHALGQRLHVRRQLRRIHRGQWLQAQLHHYSGDGEFHRCEVHKISLVSLIVYLIYRKFIPYIIFNRYNMFNTKILLQVK